MTDIYKRMNELGIKLPPPPESEGLYAPAIISGNYLYLSGSGGADPRHLPAYGKVGRDVTIQEARFCAEAAVLALLSTAEKAIGSLDNIQGFVKLLGFVNSSDDFFQHPKVIDGASELIIKIFGKDRGLHARSAVGVSSLPFNIPVEIEMIIKIKRTE